MRLSLVISSLGPGGAERVLSNMANHWQTKGHQVTLITLSGLGHDHYALDPGVRRLSAGFFSSATNPVKRILGFVRRMASLRRVIRGSEPEAVISFVDKTNVRVLMAMMRESVPVIVAERSNPERWPLSAIWHWLRQRLYPGAAALVVQTYGVKSAWAEQILPSSRVHVIPNAVAVNEVADGMSEQVMAMGRMTQEKGFDLLLHAWSIVIKQRPQSRLTILGNGPLMPELQSLAAKLEILESISFLGVVTEPYPILAQGGVFVLPSRLEGFPNALLEAMACGLTPVSFDCDYGPRDIITHEHDGLLVPAENVDALAQALLKLLGDAHLRQQLADNAKEVSQRFAPEPIMACWDNLLAAARPK